MLFRSRLAALRHPHSCGHCLFEAEAMHPLLWDLHQCDQLSLSGVHFCTEALKPYVPVCAETERLSAQCVRLQLSDRLDLVLHCHPLTAYHIFCMQETQHTGVPRQLDAAGADFPVCHIGHLIRATTFLYRPDPILPCVFTR